jgi:hypothetical protein
MRTRTNGRTYELTEGHDEANSCFPYFANAPRNTKFEMQNDVNEFPSFVLPT